MTTILVVDDSTVDRTYAAGLLAKENAWEVIEASDGKSALATIKASAPDVIVTDLQMPGLTGLELIAEVRRHHSHIPIILMTSKGSEEIAVEALQAGASSYVPKRSLSTMLVDTLERVLSAMQENRKRSELMNRLGERTETFVLEMTSTSFLPCRDTCNRYWPIRGVWNEPIECGREPRSKKPC